MILEGCYLVLQGSDLHSLYSVPSLDLNNYYYQLLLQCYPRLKDYNFIPTVPADTKELQIKVSLFRLHLVRTVGVLFKCLSLIFN